ncbi:MAG: biotin/lipoyl-binding protein, partial [Planctomycetales bacterium]|nr:biotin/lipoyl-binding protein [Planctomycetales bacterium]
ALIVEHIDSTQPQSMVAPKVEEVCEHSARAIGNALEHNSLFLMPVWKAIGHSRWALTAKNLPKTMLISGAILAALLALFILRKDFILKAEGILTPVEKKDVFFEQDGHVAEVLVDHGDKVEKGQIIIRLENNDLETQIQQLYTDLSEAQASQRQVQLSRDPESESKLAELRARIQGYNRQLAILEAKKDALIVRAPMSGEITTWNVKHLLENKRPVMRGQKALQLANPEGDWELEVFLPEKRIGHLTKAQKDSDEPLDVSYVLKSNPGSSPLDAKLSEVQRTATFHEEHGQSFRLRVNQIDKDKLLAALKKGDTPGELKQGTEVLARVHCGRANLAFCFFHELIEWAYLQLYSI